MRKLSVIACLVVLAMAVQVPAKEPVFVPVKVDGPVHNPAKGTFWYGPFSEGSAFLDVNADGKPDITCGSSWYENPTWKKHEGFRSGASVHGEFVNNCGEYAVDVNEDGRVDIISAGWMEDGVFWYENPGSAGAAWKAHKILSSVWTEGLVVEDIDGDGDADVLPDHWSHKKDQAVTWLENLKGPEFAVHLLGAQGDRHGAGVGDINGDGRKDIITPDGWWEAPVDRAGGAWKFHGDFKTQEGTSIRMLVHDVNADGRADIIYGLGHNYGLFWLEQKAPQGGALRFTAHQIDDSHGQFHTLVLADVNQDGKLDLVTGKRLRGHGDGDPSSFDPLFIFWYDLAGGEFRRRVVSFNNLMRYEPKETRNPAPNCAIGTGMNISVLDANGDGKVDILVSGKSGCYLFENRGLPPTKKMR